MMILKNYFPQFTLRAKTVFYRTTSARDTLGYIVNKQQLSLVT